MLRAARAEEEARPAFTWRIAAAFAMAVCLVIVAAQVALVRHNAAERQLEALRAEQHRIEAELAEVKEAAASNYEPVVVLEHTDGTRVVVEQTSRDTSAAQPVSYQYD